MIPENKNRLEYVDALRGVAALSVCVYHLMGCMYETNKVFYSIFKEFVFNHIDFGRFGVVLFFLISGFIIPSSLKVGSTLRTFLISRVTRLYPAYWVTCFLIIIAVPYLNQNDYTVNQFLANLTMMPKIFHAREISGVFWTLFVEILFYFMCAVLFQFRLLEKVLVLAIIAILLNISTPIAILINTFSPLHIPIQFTCFHLSFLFMGGVFKQACTNKTSEAINVSFFLLFLILITVPLTTGEFFSVSEVVNAQFAMHSARATATSYFLAVAVFMSVIYYKPSVSRFWVFVGEISYSLYLLHPLCFELTAKFFPPLSLWTSIFFIFMSLVLSFMVAKLSFMFIESPAIVFGKKMVISHNSNKAQ